MPEMSIVRGRLSIWVWLILLGAFIVGMAIWVEFHFSPPLWVHAVLWPLVTFPAAILMMRPLKAALVDVLRQMQADLATRLR